MGNGDYGLLDSYLLSADKEDALPHNRERPRKCKGEGKCCGKCEITTYKSYSDWDGALTDKDFINGGDRSFNVLSVGRSVCIIPNIV